MDFDAVTLDDIQYNLLMSEYLTKFAKMNIKSTDSENPQTRIHSHTAPFRIDGDVGMRVGFGC